MQYHVKLLKRNIGIITLSLHYFQLIMIIYPEEYICQGSINSCSDSETNCFFSVLSRTKICNKYLCYRYQ